MRKPQEPHPTTKLQSLVRFVTYTQQSELGIQVHCVGGQRECPELFCNGVYKVLEDFSSLPCFCTFQFHPYKVFSENFSLGFCTWGGGEGWGAGF